MIRRMRSVIDQKSTCHKTFFGGKGLGVCGVCIEVLGSSQVRHLQ